MGYLRLANGTNCNYIIFNQVVRMSKPKKRKVTIYGHKKTKDPTPDKKQSKGNKKPGKKTEI